MARVHPPLDSSYIACVTSSDVSPRSAGFGDSALGQIILENVYDTGSSQFPG
jgi:hypothetical protein